MHRDQLTNDTVHAVIAFTLAVPLLLVALPTRAADSGILFPRPFLMPIDDMGWNEGSSLAAEGGPWRLGVRRRFDLADYRAVVDLGRSVGVRLQGAFVLGEMDREGIASQVPTALAPGARARQRGFDAQRQLEVMQYVRDNAAHLEFGLHGVGHEHWDQGVRHRAEWYDLQSDKPWPEQDGRDHLKLFARIMAQYGWTPANGQSFPESFVPCANGYHWNPDGDTSTGKLMAEAGVKYANTDFSYVAESNPPIRFGGGFDHGLLVIHRKNYGNEWFALGARPTAAIRQFATDAIEAHWTNLLAQDYWLQGFVTNQWAELFRKIQARPDRYLAKNTEQFSSQWLYRRYAKVQEAEPGHVSIDDTAMPAPAYERDLLGNLVLAVRLADGAHVSRAVLDGQPIPAYFEEGGFGYLYLPPLERKVYRLDYAVGAEWPAPVVHHTGTYNVYSLQADEKGLRMDIEMYGTQVVEVLSEAPASAVESRAEHLEVLAFDSEPDAGRIRITLRGRDMQGERGVIAVSY